MKRNPGSHVRRQTVFLRLALVLLTWAGTGIAPAVQKYVTPTGAGAYSGNDWDNAYSNVQEAITACPNDGDSIYLKEGIYTNAVQLNVLNHPGLTIRGGYLGSGMDLGGESVLTRAAGISNRILYASVSTLTVDRVTISDGIAMSGAGICLTNSCYATITNCVVRRNSAHTGGVAGAGIYASGGTLIISATLISSNKSTLASGMALYGGGVYASGVELKMTNVTVEYNNVAPYYAYGGGVCLSGGRATISDCKFYTNSFSQYNRSGSALYALDVNPLVVSGCDFAGNYSIGSSYAHYGGTLYIGGSKLFALSRCSFRNNYTYGGAVGRGATIHIGAAADANGKCGGTIEDCTIVAHGVNGNSLEEVCLSTTGAVTIANTVIIGGRNLNGIWKEGSGRLFMTNCFIRSFPGSGVAAYQGIVTLANSTLADNFGWGLTNAFTTNTVRDCIMWGNSAGGIMTNANSTVTYTCSQEPLVGAGNICANPLFFSGYYLEAEGLLYQETNSPCIDAGSATAEALGLTNRTTRTDGSNDTGIVDLGYHATNGVSGSLSNLFIYVDAVNGDDANNGWSPDAALKTITLALSNAVDNSTIMIAAGRYVTNTPGESFPLSVQDMNLTLKGTNRAATVLDASATNRVLTAEAKGRLWIEGLTMSNGWAATGAGLYLLNCGATITNCSVSDNHPPRIDQAGYGVGIYACMGTLTLSDTLVCGNGLSYSGGTRHGGGLRAENVAVTLTNAAFERNHLYAWHGYGAGVSLSGGSALIAGCAFNTNYAYGEGEGGAAISADGVIPLRILNCDFIGNYLVMADYNSYGGAVRVSGGNSLLISNCVFRGNYMTGSATANRINQGGTLYVSGVGASAGINDCQIISSTDQGRSRDVFYVHTTNSFLLSNTSVKGGAKSGSGIAKDGSGSLSLVNCLVYSHATNGLTVATGTVAVVNSTLANNGAWGVSNVVGVATVVNCIAWGNLAGGLGVNCDVAYTCAQEAHAGEGNLEADPVFKDAAAGNYRLAPSSPCINAGITEPWMLDALDLDGQPRVRYGIVDMGAYERVYDSTIFNLQ